MARMRLVLVALLLLTACAPHSDERVPPPYDVYMKPGQQRDVVDDARASVAEWNAKLGFEALVWHEDGAPDPEACGTVVIGFGGRLAFHDAQASTDLSDPCHISVNLSATGFWDSTIRHELGHVLGLEDLPDDETVTEVQRIMRQGTLDREITAEDVELVHAHWGW